MTLQHGRDFEEDVARNGKITIFVEDMPVVGSEADERDMKRMGKVQEMQRNFRFATMFGFSAVVMSSWEAVLSTSRIALFNGGTAGLLYDAIISCVGWMAVYVSLAELASMAPTSGGMYHWVSEFASSRYQRLASYAVGWLSALGWQTGVAFMAYIAGTQIQGLIILNHPLYQYERWHGTLLTLAILLFALVLNTFFAHYLHFVQGCVLLIHIVGIVTIIAILWANRSMESASHEEVWTRFSDPGWHNQGASCIVGLIATAAPLLGGDGAVHMAEELRNAAFVLPRVMISSVLLNSLMMFVMCLTISYCVGSDLTAVLNTSTGFPFIQIFYNTTKSLPATNAMTSLIIILSAFCCATIMAAASRQLFAFARDQALPFSAWIARIPERQKIPLNAISVVFVIASAIALLNIGSTEALLIITSLGLSALSTSCIACISCLVWRRSTNQPLLPSQFDLGRWVGLIINIVALCWLSLIELIAFFPPVPLPLLKLEMMNWSSLVWCGVVVFSGMFFIFKGRKAYVGPVEYTKKLEG